MSDTTIISKRKLASLEDRVKKLAADKSNLQLIVGLMSRVGAISGLDSVVEHLLRGVCDLIGGVNAKLYYRLNDELWCADILEGKRKIAVVEDDAVRRAMEQREFVEIEHPFSDTQMMVPEFTKAYTWAVPLQVGSELVGVLKMESLHVATRDLSRHLPTFFSFAALVLKNEISGHSRLQKAYVDLEHEMVVRKEAEEQLRRANEELESRVARRTGELHRLNRELRAISKCNLVLMRATAETALLKDICRIICDEAGYRMAWVGYAENDEARTLRPVAWAGIEEGYLVQLNLTWADTEHGRGPAGTAVRRGASVCIQDFTTDPETVRWRENALQHGYRSNIALPLKDENKTSFGVLTIYSTEPNAFSPGEVRLLEELAGDLAFGITVLRSRAERKHAEEMLRKQARLNQALFNQAISCFVIFDRNWKFIQVNEAYAKHYEKNPADLVGRTYQEVFPPPDLALFAAVTRELVDLKKPVVLTESLYIFPDQPERGETYWDIILQPLLNDQGEVEFIFFSSIDVTERKRAQQRVRDLAAIVESTDDAVIGKTLDEKIVSWNRGAEQIYGYTAAEMIGQPLSVLVPADRRDELNVIMARLKNGERIRHFETERLRKDGKLVIMALTISPIKDASGQIVGASTIARDITERKRMDDALLFVAQRGWQTGTESFLNALARFLCEKLEMDYAFIDKTDENRDLAETVALCAKGVIAPNLRYALKGTPCENVMGRNLCVYREGIQQLFPDDALLVQMGAESYIGIPLWDSSGQPIGLIAVMGNKPIADAAPATQLLQLVATRAAAELERNRAAEVLLKLNAGLEQRVRERTAELQREMDSRHRQQQFLEAVLESTDAGIVACDADGILTLFNRKTRDLHGLPPTPIPAEHWAEHYDLFLSDGKTPMRKEDVPLFRALQGERVVNEEMMIIPHGGEPKILLANGQFILDKEGRKIGAVVAMHDITERKRAEQAIQKLNAELQQRASELQTANQELQRMNRLFIGRELRMVELKEKLKALTKMDPDSKTIQTKDLL